MKVAIGASLSLRLPQQRVGTGAGRHRILGQVETKVTRIEKLATLSDGSASCWHRLIVMHLWALDPSVYGLMYRGLNADSVKVRLTNGQTAPDLSFRC